jgi:hypothetical protein
LRGSTDPVPGPCNVTSDSYKMGKDNSIIHDVKLQTVSLAVY